MKVTTQSIEPKPFQPVSLTITFEGQDELDKMIVLFNSGKVGASIGWDITYNIYKALKSLMTDGWLETLQVRTDEFHRELKQQLNN